LPTYQSIDCAVPAPDHICIHVAAFRVTMAPKEAAKNPSFVDMFAAAIAADKSPKGITLPAIKKFIADKFKLPEPLAKKIALYLRKAVEAGKLKQIKVRTNPPYGWLHIGGVACACRAGC
jgi:hypothetical protein